MTHHTINAYQPRQHLSRLGQWRLKRAKRDLADAIAAAEERYNRAVATILSTDRDAVIALRRGERANWRHWGSKWREPVQVLANVFGTAMPAISPTGAPDPRWICFPAQLLRRHGYREARRG